MRKCFLNLKSRAFKFSLAVFLGLFLLGAIAAFAQTKEKTNPAVTSKEVQIIGRKLSQLRDLQLRWPIQIGQMSREEMLSYIEEKFAKEYSDQEIATESAVFKRLGLLPESADYRQSLLDLLRDQVAGFYDPTPHRLYLLADVQQELQSMALVHEICHALQDQNFGLKKFTKPLKENSDAQLARSALIEGDCTATMIEYLFHLQGLDWTALAALGPEVMKKAIDTTASPQLKAAPLLLRELMTFPYLSGLEFVRLVRARQPWRALSPIYARLPASTEQIMHPEKYWRQDKPLLVKSPKIVRSLAGYKKIRQDVLGEFMLRLFLGEALEEASAARAAEGWNGDLLVAYRWDSVAGPSEKVRKKNKPTKKQKKDVSSEEASEVDAGEAPTSAPVEMGPLLLIHLSTWESEADAREFLNGVRQLWKKKKMPLLDEEKGRLWRYADEEKGLENSLEQRQKNVLMIIGAPATIRSALSDEIVRAWTAGGKRLR